MFGDYKYHWFIQKFESFWVTYLESVKLRFNFLQNNGNLSVGPALIKKDCILHTE
jgi:hypothetical protein